MSIELPNGKVSLTLPEQVGKNAKDIDEIKKVIDGLDSLDNVVIVPDISYVMTAAELESVKQPVCFIAYNDHIYLKRNEQSGTAYFDVVFSIIASTVITFESSEIQVNLSNGALGIVNSTVSTYSKNQIDTLVGAKADLTYVDSQLALKANLSSANFEGAVTAPTLRQSQANYALDFSMSGSNGLTAINVYNRFEEINGILYCISNVQVKNETAGSITVGSNNILAQAVVTLSSQIADKVYTMEGKKVSEVPTGTQAGVALERTNYSVNSNFTGFSSEDVVFNIIQPQQANVVYVGFRVAQSVTIAAGASIYLSARIAMTLI